jgi:adenylosuccinate lyase
VASLSTVVELLKGQINATAANGVHWGTLSVFVASLSYFLELKSKLELLRSRRNADLTEDLVDALLTRVHTASNSLVSHVPPVVTRSPPNDVG